MDLNLVRENIECEQLLGESFVNTPMKGEYVIPDTHPDVYKVIMLDTKPSITTKKIVQDKVYVEGLIDYNILYLTKEEDEDVLYNTTYTGKFSNDIQISGAEDNMVCEAECFVEDMECKVVNERKVSVEGVVRLKAEVYKDYNFEVVKDVDDMKDIQMLRNPTSVDKIVGTATGELIAKSNIKIGTDKPEVGSIIKRNISINKRKVEVLEDKINVEAFANIELAYRGKDTRDICCLNDEVFINKEIDLEGANSFMDSYTDFEIDGVEIEVKEDDLGENRVVDVEALVKSNTKVMYKKEIEVIEDMYCPEAMLDIKKKDYELNVMHGQTEKEHIVKNNIEIDSTMPKVKEILMTNGKVCVTDKKLVEDKVMVEGVLNVEVMYKTTDDKEYIYTLKDNIPFDCSIDMPGCKIDMECIVKANLDNIETSMEANTIAVKGIVDLYGRVNYNVHKEFLIGVEPIEDSKPEKKASITIYVVQQGDTLWKIAKRYYTTIENLMSINEIENADVIKPGQKLIIPGKAII